MQCFKFFVLILLISYSLLPLSFFTQLLLFIFPAATFLFLLLFFCLTNLFLSASLLLSYSLAPLSFFTQLMLFTFPAATFLFLLLFFCL
ncbi:MAG: hypothetical protein CL471_02465, partial [Acidobacteria bacterium]|nr:hypothetical protein [Acidobacteriota bacterium]